LAFIQNLELIRDLPLVVKYSSSSANPW